MSDRKFSVKYCVLLPLVLIVTILLWALPTSVFGIEGLTPVQQRMIAIFLCLLLMVPAANVLTPFGVPFLDPILAILANLLVTVFILLLSFRA